MSINSPADNFSLPKNVFVTQINEREDENNDGVVHHAIVKESPSNLLQSGYNTYQTTLVIKKESELTNIDAEFYEKKKEYEKQMAHFFKKKQSLLLKQQTLLDQMKSFDSFIKENDAKRKRALIKYQNEVRLINQQKIIENDLKNEIVKTKILHEKLLKKVKKNKKYEDFLLKVIELLPPDYIKVSENVLGGLIMRYNTLFATNEMLLVEMNTKSEENHFYTNLITNIKEENARQLLQNNYRLSKMYEEYEKLKEELSRGEQNLKFRHGDLRMEILNYGLVLRSIDNIAKKCARRFEEVGQADEFDSKIEKIQNYIISTKQILEMVKSNSPPPSNQQKPLQNTNRKIKSGKQAKNKILKSSGK